MNIYATYQVLLNLPNIDIESVDLGERKIVINCRLSANSCICPTCNRVLTKVIHSTQRQLRDLNMCEREVHLSVRVRQFYCEPCNKYPTERIDFADDSKSYTHRQAKYIFELCQKQSYKEIAAIVNMTSKTVERLVLDICKKRLNLPKRYAQVRRLGIDEHSHRKGKKSYICVLTDLDRGIIVDILPNRKKETLIAHFQALGADFAEQITDVSCDIWSPYIHAAKELFPKANIVLDRFHVIKILNSCLDKVRRDLRKNQPDEIAFRPLKWILFKQYHLLSDKELDQIQAAFAVSSMLEQLYFFREQFNQILDNGTDPVQTVLKIEQWEAQIKENQIVAFDTFITTLSNWKIYIANYVLNQLSNATTEGLNNLIRTIRRVSFGIPNFEHLRLRAMSMST